MPIQAPNSALASAQDLSSASQSRQAPLPEGKILRREGQILCLCIIAGAILGLSCPGFSLGYLAWIALSPLLVAVFTSLDRRQACLRACLFGLAYNMVYLHWLICTEDFAWTGLARHIPQVMAVGAWLVFSAQQALIIGIFALAVRSLPLRSEKAFHWSSLLVLPLLWVLIVNRLGNAACLLGVPWTMLEYSQYKVLPLLQICPYVGGIGLEALLVLVNAAIAMLALAFIDGSSKRAPALNCLAAITLVFALYGWGSGQLSAFEKARRILTVAVVQGNINPLKERISPKQAVSDMVQLSCRAPAGLCVWTEWSVPCSFSKKSYVFEKLAAVASAKKQDWLVGAFDENSSGQSFNIACALSAGGVVLPQPYSKRFLVPFGEYVPYWLKVTPLNAIFSDENDVNFSAGKEATVFKLGDKIVAPILCFESISPEIVSESVRAGGEIITNLSNTMWFRSRFLGEQMLAMSAFRAAEANRSLVFATNTGPSAMIEPSGKIRARAPGGKASLLVESMPLCSELTPFSRWYR